MKKGVDGMDEKRRIQEKLNHSLSGLKEDPFLAQRVIAQAKGEPEMKKKLTSSLVLVIVLCLALIGGAYALFSSQVADFFGKHWNKDLGDWLQDGKTAQVGESVTVGDVIFTLDEVVYRNRGIYGVGTARPVNSKDVLVPMDLADEWNTWSQKKEGKDLSSLAAASGGRLLTVNCIPDKVGVDEGAMLTVNAGVYNVRNEDGSITYSFEATGYALEDGTSYQITFDYETAELEPGGKQVEGSRKIQSGTVSFTPVVLAEKAKEPESTATGMENLPKDDYEVLTPAVYQETGSLPIRKAIETDFTKLVQPEWFNQSGILQDEGGTNLTFKDHAVLQISPHLLWYSEYTDELFDYNWRAREMDDPDLEPAMLPRQALSSGITDIASNVYWQTGDYTRGITLDKQELTYVSLESAKAQAEELMNRLNLTGYELAWALDMDLDRIRTLGKQYNEFWFEGPGFSNSPRQDYDTATADDEGYYLYYTPLGITKISDTRQEICFFINRRGIVFASIRSNYTMGDVIETPKALISPRQALVRFSEATGEAWNEIQVARIERVALTYAAVRAENKQDGMVFAPVWQIRYLDKDAYDNSYPASSAQINAVTGAVVNTDF